MSASAHWLLMAALALAATSSWAPPAAGSPPELLLIVYGSEFASYRTPVFLRTLLSTRTVPLRLHVLADGPGHAGFERAVEEHARPLMWPEDHIRALRVDELPLASEYLERVHPLCHQNGYAYLFLKLLAPELLPDVDHLIVLDPDTVVLADIALLWAQFSQFGPGHLLSMAVDQSDRYYHRLQDPADEVYSEGWAGVPHSLGVNGGVILLRAAAARNANFSDLVASVTHHAAALRVAGRLDRYCELAEQDTLNYMLAQRPDLWRPLDCSWNYMATERGGHRLVTDPHLVASFYDECPDGTRGAQGAAGGDLLRCSCGERVRLLHFVGGTRGHPLLAALNESLWNATADQLRALASLRRRRPDGWAEAREPPPDGWADGPEETKPDGECEAEPG